MNEIEDFLNNKSSHLAEPSLKISEMIRKDNDWWESSHDHIQWIFPNSEPSNFNELAPLLNPHGNLYLTEEGIQYIKMAYARFLNFLYNVSFVDEQNNHNYLRITRAIKFEKYLKSKQLITNINFHKEVLLVFKNIKVPKQTLEFWKEASR